MRDLLSRVLKNTEGSALILAIALVTLLTTIALGYAAFVNTEFHMGVNDTEDLQAVYLAEAGINQAIVDLKDRKIDALFSNGNFVLESKAVGEIGSPKVEVFSHQLYITIKSTGTFRDITRVIEAKVQSSAGDGRTPLGSSYKILSWHEY